MYKERRDNKGRLLHPGEVQRPNGRYMFRYKDPEGNRRSVSSYRLLPWDIGKDGTSDQECLRDMELRVRRSLIAGQVHDLSDDATVNDFWEKFLSLKVELAESTVVNYIYLYNRHVRKTFGLRQIRKVKYSDVRRFYISKLEEGLRMSSIKNLQNLLGPVFELALRDGYITQNPTNGIVNELARRKDWEPRKREALTEDEQERLIDYVAGSYRYREWLNYLTVALGTGMRVGEILGLVWSNVDFLRNIIRVDHTLNYDLSLNGRCEYYITFPKSRSAVREIPMLSDVKETLLKMFERREDFNADRQIIVDGYTGFIFRDIHGNLYNDSRVNTALKSIQKSYNKQEEESAKEEKRNPRPLPPFSSHHLRHTFCTRLCQQKVAIRTIQYIMGHAHPETTLAIYATVCGKSNQEEIAALNGKLKLK